MYICTISATCIYNKWVTFNSSFFYHSFSWSNWKSNTKAQVLCCKLFLSRLIKAYIFGRVYEIVNYHIISWTLSTTYVRTCLEARKIREQYCCCYFNTYPYCNVSELFIWFSSPLFALFMDFTFKNWFILRNSRSPQKSAIWHAKYLWLNDKWNSGNAGNSVIKTQIQRSDYTSSKSTLNFKEFQE